MTRVIRVWRRSTMEYDHGRFDAYGLMRPNTNRMEMWWNYGMSVITFKKRMAWFIPLPSPSFTSLSSDGGSRMLLHENWIMHVAFDTARIFDENKWRCVWWKYKFPLILPIRLVRAVLLTRWQHERFSSWRRCGRISSGMSLHSPPFQMNGGVFIWLLTDDDFSKKGIDDMRAHDF